VEINTKQSGLTVQFLIAIVASLLFIPFAGGVNLFDWDEINFAESAREMIISHDYLNVQIHFMPFWEKPPLFIWLQVLSMKAFGINEFAARFPNAVCGVVTLLLIFNIGRKLFDARFGIWWVVAYTGSILPHFYFRSGIIDPWFNLLIFTAIWFFFQLHRIDRKPTSRQRFFHSALWGVFTGLAILTKGPTALLIIGLVAAITYLPSLLKGIHLLKSTADNKPQFQLRLADLSIFLIFTILIGGSWFFVQLFTGHSDMVWKFISYQIRLFTIPDAGHGGNWTYHLVVLLVGVFPASVFALQGFRVSNGNSAWQQQFQKVMLILFWVVLILFTIVKTKIVHYSSLCYLPLTFLSALVIRQMLLGKLRWPGWLNGLLILIAGLFAVFTFFLPFIDCFKDRIIRSGMINDDFALANLQAEVHWTGYESLAGVFLLIGIITAIILRKKHLLSAFRILFGTTIIFTWLIIMIFPYKIEQYSQRAVIDFYKQISTEDCYVKNVGYFSYAPLFYAKIKPDEKYKNPHFVMWLLTGNIDKQTYFVAKVPEYEEYKQYLPALKELYRKNGFVFLVRIPEKYPFKIPD